MWLDLLSLDGEPHGRHGWCMLFVLLVFAGVSVFNTHTQQGDQKERDKIHDRNITNTLLVLYGA